MSKIKTNLTIDEGLIKTLKAQDVNISALVNEFLQNYVEINPIQKKREELERELSKTQAKVIKLQEQIAKLKKQEIKAELERGIKIKIGD